MKALKQRGYAVMAANAVRAKSSSGGVFTIVAEAILARGGAVCGAAFDENMECRHVIVETVEGLEALRGSKYVRSTLPRGLFADIRRLLAEGRTVLFSGTPCQVAAANRIIGEHPRFYTIDLICNGAPRPDLFRQYLVENWGDGKVKDYCFRHKRDGWQKGKFIIRVVLKNGKVGWRKSSSDEYMKAFNRGLSLGDGCFHCPFSKLERPGDITLGDFWGVRAKFDDKKGTSVVLVNTEKGGLLFAGCRGRFKLCREVPLEEIRTKQPRLRCPPPPVPALESYRADAAKMTLAKALARNIFPSQRSVGILNFHWETTNFGAVLTAYALNRALRGMGWYARNVDFCPPVPRLQRKEANPVFDRFRQKHLPMTQQIESMEELGKLNQRYWNFVFGSDQVWNPNMTSWFLDAYFGTFARPTRRFFSAAASFGCDARATYGDAFLKVLAKSFDAISVRESAVADAFAEIGAPVSLVVDPVFLLKREEWAALAEESRVEGAEKDIVCYEVSKENSAAVEAYLGLHAAELVENFTRLDSRREITEWIYRVSRTRLLLTDSFHGMCFALIFNRPFAVIAQPGPKAERMRGLLERFGVQGRLYGSYKDMPSPDELARPLEAPLLQERMAEARQEFADFLKRSLESDPAPDRERFAARRDFLRLFLRRVKAEISAARWKIVRAGLFCGWHLVRGRNLTRDMQILDRLIADYEARRGMGGRLVAALRLVDEEIRKLP